MGNQVLGIGGIPVSECPPSSYIELSLRYDKPSSDFKEAVDGLHHGLQRVTCGTWGKFSDIHQVNEAKGTTISVDSALTQGIELSEACRLACLAEEDCGAYVYRSDTTNDRWSGHDCLLRSIDEIFYSLFGPSSQWGEFIELRPTLDKYCRVVQTSQIYLPDSNDLAEKGLQTEVSYWDFEEVNRVLMLYFNQGIYYQKDEQGELLYKNMKSCLFNDHSTGWTMRIGPMGRVESLFSLLAGLREKLNSKTQTDILCLDTTGCPKGYYCTNIHQPRAEDGSEALTGVCFPLSREADCADDDSCSEMTGGIYPYCHLQDGHCSHYRPCAVDSECPVKGYRCLRSECHLRQCFQDTDCAEGQCCQSSFGTCYSEGCKSDLKSKASTFTSVLLTQSTQSPGDAEMLQSHHEPLALRGSPVRLHAPLRSLGAPMHFMDILGGLVSDKRNNEIYKRWRNREPAAAKEVGKRIRPGMYFEGELDGASQFRTTVANDDDVYTEYTKDSLFGPEHDRTKRQIIDDYFLGVNWEVDPNVQSGGRGPDDPLNVCSQCNFGPSGVNFIAPCCEEYEAFGCHISYIDEEMYSEEWIHVNGAPSPLENNLIKCRSNAEVCSRRRKMLRFYDEGEKHEWMNHNICEYGSNLAEYIDPDVLTMITKMTFAHKCRIRGWPKNGDMGMWFCDDTEEECEYYRERWIPELMDCKSDWYKIREVITTTTTTTTTFAVPWFTMEPLPTTYITTQEPTTADTTDTVTYTLGRDSIGIILSSGVIFLIAFLIFLIMGFTGWAIWELMKNEQHEVESEDLDIF